MSTLHEIAQTLRAINHEVGTDPVHGGEIVTHWAPVNLVLNGRKTLGYRLSNGKHDVAFIETLKHDDRIGAHLTRYVNGVNAARTIVRALLNAEDYTSTIYDQIVRVHYAAELRGAVAVPGNSAPGDIYSTMLKAQMDESPAFARVVGKTLQQRAADHSGSFDRSAPDYATDKDLFRVKGSAAHPDLLYAKTDKIDWRKDAYEGFSKKRYQK